MPDGQGRARHRLLHGSGEPPPAYHADRPRGGRTAALGPGYQGH
ncbi:hypothetical protein P9869_24435 [Streptomyces ossamyceticus]|nr:hypothetical protein [Streptomyces ossamyceticus]